MSVPGFPNNQKLIEIKASEDYDENLESSPMKRLSDSGLDTSLSHNGSPNLDSKEEKDEMDACWKAFFEANLCEIDSDEDMSQWYTTDNDVLNWGRYSWRMADRLNGREVYHVILVCKSLREESKCLELLDEIGCKERYLGCSIEMNTVFFANLNKDEATRLEGMNEVHKVMARRYTVSDI